MKLRLTACALALILGAGALWAGKATTAEAPPRRIVSMNACSDQLLLALADRSQIVALSRNAADPEMSAAAGQARGFPRIRGTVEEVLALEPDLVLGAPLWTPAAANALGKDELKSIGAPFPASFADIEADIRATAAAVGHPERGEALIARMRRDLAAVPRNGNGRVAAEYQRRGYLTGTGTLTDELMRRAGLVNLAHKLGKPVISRVSLEEMVATPPDLLIVGSPTQQVVDQGTEMLAHPVLRNIRRVAIPDAWLVCGGPATVRAAQALSQQLARR